MPSRYVRVYCRPDDQRVFRPVYGGVLLCRRIYKRNCYYLVSMLEH